MADLICDFCALANPSWEYMADGVLLPNGVESIGSWCACDTCRELIDADDRDGLARRAFLAAPMSVSKHLIRVTQDMFFDHRTGGAQPIKLTPIHGRIFDRGDS